MRRNKPSSAPHPHFIFILMHQKIPEISGRNFKAATIPEHLQNQDKEMPS